MKNKITNQLSSLFFGIALFLISPLALAQENGGLDIDVDIAKDQPQDWMSNPLYWIIGALIVLLIISIIARSGRK